MSRILNKEIVDARRMTDEELRENGWSESHRNPPVLVLEDGTTIYPSCDTEMNQPGALFGTGDVPFFVNP